MTCSLVISNSEMPLSFAAFYPWLPTHLSRLHDNSAGPVDGCDGILRCMAEVTQILNRIERGDRKAAEQLLPLVYDELRKLAAAKLVQ